MKRREFLKLCAASIAAPAALAKAVPVAPDGCTDKLVELKRIVNENFQVLHAAYPAIRKQIDFVQEENDETFLIRKIQFQLIKVGMKRKDIEPILIILNKSAGETLTKRYITFNYWRTFDDILYVVNDHLPDERPIFSIVFIKKKDNFYWRLSGSGMTAGKTIKEMMHNLVIYGEKIKGVNGGESGPWVLKRV